VFYFVVHLVQVKCLVLYCNCSLSKSVAVPLEIVGVKNLPGPARERETCLRYHYSWLWSIFSLQCR